MAEHDTREPPRAESPHVEPSLTDPHAAEAPDASGFIWAGVVLVVLGALALLFPLVSTVAVTLILGVVFIAAGLVKFWRALYTRPASRAVLKGLWALVYLIGGGLIVAAPVSGAWSITVILAVLFMFGGIASIAWAMARPRPPGWGWMLASGVVSVALGLLVGLTTPATALWLPGALAGLDLITTGAAFIAMDRIATHLRGGSGFMPI
jgi:uncharacterized membrane protein HdeD (DUF308 family)